MELVDGQRYCLPNGEKVTAKLIDGKFLLEFKRKYRSPLSVEASGELFLRGQATGFTIGSLVKDEEPEL